MHIITLTSDYGHKDFFVSAIKGHILSELGDVKIVDISHDIKPFNIIEAAYIIKNTYMFFPKGTIHIIALNNEHDINEHIVTYIDGHYFIGPHSQVFSLIFPLKNADQIVLINISGTYHTDLFPAKDIFIDVAGHILRGGKLNVVGEKINNFKPANHSLPIQKNNETTLMGTIIYIDRFGNIITNIEKDFFDKIKRGRDFIIHLPRKHTINNIGRKYSDVPEADVIALFNSSNMLEIAINRADKNAKNGASTLLGINQGDEIIIHFN